MRPLHAMSRATTSRLARRRLLAIAAAVLASGGTAQATPEAARELLRSLARGTAPRTGRVELRLDDLADNGNQVPITVAVQSPMSEADHVRAVHVVADGNPNPGVASFFFTPRAGRCEVGLRVRLAKSQRIYALAETSDGALWLAQRDVTVTVGGCVAQ
jgi:sulfur-oxidizing protein SoxY